MAGGKDSAAPFPIVEIALAERLSSSQRVRFDAICSLGESLSISHTSALVGGSASRFVSGFPFLANKGGRDSQGMRVKGKSLSLGSIIVGSPSLQAPR